MTIDLVPSAVRLYCKCQDQCNLDNLFYVLIVYFMHELICAYHMCDLRFIFKGLRRHLLEELEQAFPDEVEDYREIRASSAAVSSFKPT